MFDDKLINEIRNQDSFEWSENRYYYDKNLTTLDGHAKKHLDKEYDRFRKIIDYDVNNIDNQAIEDYKKISIENINQNKYVNNRVYYDKKNGSLNIVGDNNLETCLKPSISKNYKLVITTCFFRDYVYNFYNILDKYTKEDLQPVFKYFTTNDITSKPDSNNIDVEEVMNNFILSLEKNRNKNIIDMVNSYYKKDLSFNKAEVQKEINYLLNSIKSRINNLKEAAKENGLVLEDIKTIEYSPEMTTFLDDLDNIIEELEKIEVREKFVASIELSDIYDIIMDLSIIYIYYKMSNDLDKLKDWCKYMHYILQLNTNNNELRNTILDIKYLLGFEEVVENTLYSENAIELNYCSKWDKHNIKGIREKIDNMSKDYDDNTFISCYYCDNCKHYKFFIEKCDDKRENIKCDKCGNDNLEYIISNAEVNY